MLSRGLLLADLFKSFLSPQQAFHEFLVFLSEDTSIWFSCLFTIACFQVFPALPRVPALQLLCMNWTSLSSVPCHGILLWIGTVTCWEHKKYSGIRHLAPLSNQTAPTLIEFSSAGTLCSASKLGRQMYYVAQAGLNLVISCLCLLSSGITDLLHYAWF